MCHSGRTGSCYKCCASERAAVECGVLFVETVVADSLTGSLSGVAMFVETVASTVVKSTEACYVYDGDVLYVRLSYQGVEFSGCFRVPRCGGCSFAVVVCGVFVITLKTAAVE